MRSLALLFVAVVGLVAFEGCGSDSPSATKKADAGLGAAGAPAAGECRPSYCMSGCCAANKCGVNTANGCVPAGPDAGAH